MATALRPNWALIVRQAVVAGIVGAVIFNLYLWLTTVLPAHGSFISLLLHSASIALGPTALNDPTYAWVGALVELIAGMGWAGGYAYFAQRQPFVNARWFISGSVYGGVVYVLWLLLLLGAHAFPLPATVNAQINDVIARTVFFGVPVAFVVAQLDRT
ncbi:MAG TPA: hypothetical protein VF741_01385 [Candidatus Aquilonibacter sp.]